MLSRNHSGLTRRQVLRAGTFAAGGLTGAGVLAACSGKAAVGSGTPANAAPTPAAGAIILNFAPQSATAGTSVKLNQEFVDQAYNAKHTGVYVRVQPNIQGQASGQIAASIGLSGFMDVFQDCCDGLVAWESSGFLTPLDPYLKKDNVDTAIWPQRHLEVLTFGGQVKGLPSYDGPVTVFYRQDILDTLGLPYPSPDWTWQEAAAIWEACSGMTTSGSKQQQRYGVSLFVTAGYEQIDWWLHGWGGALMDSTRTHCLADSAGGAACMDFIAGLNKNKVAMGRTGITEFAQGTAVFKQAGGWELLGVVQAVRDSVKWDILPSPKWPSGRSTFNNIDFYGLNAATKHPDAAWELLKWVGAAPDFQRFQMQLTLIEPSLLSLWDEWQASVLSVAPPLKGKALHWLKDAEVGGYAWPNRFFKFNAAQSDTVINTWFDSIWSGKTSGTLGLKQMSAQLNALEQAGSASANAATAVAKAFPTTGPVIAAVQPGL